MNDIASQTSLQSDDALDLTSIAYENVHGPVFHAWLKLRPSDQLLALRDRYIFYSVSNHLGTYVAELQRVNVDVANAFVAAAQHMILEIARTNPSFSEDWFKGLDLLIGALTNLHFIPEARTLAALALRTGARKYPRIAQSIAIHAACLDSLVGKREKAARVALRLVQRPYLLPSRRELPATCQRLMHILAADGHFKEYRYLLWTGVTLLETPQNLRGIFAHQIASTYRGSARAALFADAPLKFRLPFLIARMDALLGRIPILRKLAVNKLFAGIHLVAIYILHATAYRKNELFRSLISTQSTGGVASQPALSSLNITRRANPRGRRRRILVTRAMGGIGDIMMMTPGLRALARKHSGAQIDFATPRAFHPMLEGLPGITLLDIDEDEIFLASYHKWINLTDCPAGRLEARQYPNIRTNRIDIFSRSMGVSSRYLRRNGGFIPHFQLQEEESSWARRYIESINPDRKKVIGIQPFSADSYKNWPYMQELSRTLGASNCVLIFHNEEPTGYDFPGVHKVTSSLRRSIALASQCDHLFVVDSSFLHISAPLGVPTTAIFGPTSGRIFTRHYRNVTHLAPPKAEFPCNPCWRNENKPCHLTGGRESVCLRSITVARVLSEGNAEATLNQPRRSFVSAAIGWLRHGSE